MKKPVFLLCLILVTVASSCTGGKMMEKLSDIESFIDAHPDSALAAIRSIDTLQLRTRQVRAKFALLHAMALDKNYIDTADTRIVMPAVEYYEKHGSPEEKFKAYMYLGTEEYNAGLYNQAIVSFNQSNEHSYNIADQNLLGVLNSKIANTFIKTQDYIQGNDYLDKAIACFEESGRQDQLNLVRIMKALHLIRLMDWEEADDFFKLLLLDDSLSDKQKGYVEGHYAMMFLYNPSLADSSALIHFQKAIAFNSSLENVDQYCAYAYLLGSLGKSKESNLLFEKLNLSDYKK